jgi:hypothetical protein
MRTDKKHRKLVSRVARKKWPDSNRGARETMDGGVIRGAIGVARGTCSTVLFGTPENGGSLRSRRL